MIIAVIKDFLQIEVPSDLRSFEQEASFEVILELVTPCSPCQYLLTLQAPRQSFLLYHW